MHKENVIITYLRLLGKEFLSPLNYFMAFLIGVVINFFQGIGVFSSIVPYLVPIIVQSLSKASVKFSNRNLNVLVRLPMERKDPAFVMGPEGEIIGSEGVTKKILEQNNISSFQDFFGGESLNQAGKMLHRACESLRQEQEEFFSNSLQKWYNINLKADTLSHNLLVWFDDITLRKKLDEKLRKVRNFSTGMMKSIDEQVMTNDSYDRLARFILDEGYKGVFITNINDQGNLEGHAYKGRGEGMQKSDKIRIDKNSNAPIWESRKQKGIVTASRAKFLHPAEFDETYLFDSNILQFMGFTIENFVNYHEENVSFIVFNKGAPITPYDTILMEAIVNSAFTMHYLIHKIHGK